MSEHIDYSRLVRVRVEGQEFNVGHAYAVAEGLEVLDESAYDAIGEPRPASRAGGRPAKPRISVAEAAAKKAAKSAEDTDNPPSEKE